MRLTLATSRKGKGFPYSLPSVGPGTDPGVQAVSQQVTISNPPGGRLQLSARPAVTFPAAKHYRFLTGTKLYCLATEEHRREQLAQGCYVALPRVDLNPRPVDHKSNVLPVVLPRHLSYVGSSPEKPVTILAIEGQVGVYTQ